MFLLHTSSYIVKCYILFYIFNLTIQIHNLSQFHVCHVTRNLVINKITCLKLLFVSPRGGHFCAKFLHTSVNLSSIGIAYIPTLGLKPESVPPRYGGICIKVCAVELKKKIFKPLYRLSIIIAESWTLVPLHYLPEEINEDRNMYDRVSWPPVIRQ